MELVMSARKPDEVFISTVVLPVDAKIHKFKLTSKENKYLVIKARLGLYSERTLEVIVLEDGKEVYFELQRQADWNPRFFLPTIRPRDIKNHWRFVKTAWVVSALITKKEEQRLVYQLVNENPGLTAHQLSKLFGAPIGETLRRLANLGRVERRDFTRGRWHYYPFGI